MVKNRIQIIEENANFIVLIKPEGFSVHNQLPSVADELSKLNKAPHFVNRLDHETTGLMVIAKEPELHMLLAESLEQGQKIYRALLRSPWKEKQTEVTWKWPLSDKAEGRRN